MIYVSSPYLYTAPPGAFSRLLPGLCLPPWQLTTWLREAEEEVGLVVLAVLRMQASLPFQQVCLVVCVRHQVETMPLVVTGVTLGSTFILCVWVCLMTLSRVLVTTVVKELLSFVLNRSREGVAEAADKQAFKQLYQTVRELYLSRRWWCKCRILFLVKKPLLHVLPIWMRIWSLQFVKR